MKTTLTRLFTVMMLIMVSMGAKADVKVLFGEKGESTFKNDAGTIEVKQDVSKKDATKITVYLIVTPNKGYSMKEKDAIEAYATAPANINPTRAPQASEKLTLDCDNFKDEYSTRTYYVDIDPNLALWVKSADFQKKESGAKGGVFSGIWYIANETNHGNTNIGTHWYLVPGRNPQQPHYADAYFNNQFCNTSGNGDYTEDNYGDSGKPFLTTYQTSQDLNSVWIVVSTDDGYYNIIHARTGKYVVYEPPYKDAKQRKSVHLETITGTPGDNAKFTITGSLSSAININPKSVTSGDMYFNPAVGVGNRAQYYGTGTYFHEGMIGLYSGSGDKSQWYFEKASPIITFSADGMVQINSSVPSSVSSTIYYRTDGTDPTTADTQYTSEFTPDEDATCIKAIVVIGGVQSNVACVPVLPGSAHTFLLQSLGYTSAIPHDGFFLQPGDVSSGNITVTTSSVARPLMQWYLELAGNDSDHQYYYFVNPESGNYLFCNSSGGVYMKTATDFDAESNDYKFYLQTDASSGYRIVPRALPTKWINKANGHNANNAVNTSNNITDLSCRWEFILSFDHKMPVALRPTPFTASTASSVSYYKIGNASATTYYIVPGATYVTTSETVSEDMAWYFVKEESDDWLDYYYVVNAVTGKYMCFDGDATKTGNDNAFIIKKFSSDNKDRYQFVVAKTQTSSTDGKYYIVPKVLKDLTYTNYSLVRRDGTYPLKTQAQRADDDRKWTFATHNTFTCATPEIVYNATQGTATITCATLGAKIYYVRYTDNTGADPDLTDPAIKATLTLYEGPVDMYGYSYIKAIAARSYDDGSDQSASISEGPIAAFKCSQPVIKFSSSTSEVTISCATDGATIYYTLDESVPDPTNAGDDKTTKVYNGPFIVNGSPIIKAVAVKNEDVSTMSTVAEYNKIPVTISSWSSEYRLNGNYMLAENFSAPDSPIGTVTDPFTGTIDGGYHAISLSHALIGVAQDAIIKNVIVASGDISGNGAIAEVAKGDARIYNCGYLGGTITGTGNVGGLVGEITDNARVINCYSFATVSGGTNMGGIVGYNNYASKSGDIRTMVMNCMFYGTISGSGNISPVYGGLPIHNLNGDTETGLNTYNYYRYETNKKNITAGKYNNALAAKDQYLKRFELYRQLLNGNRKLAAWYATGDANMGIGENNEMAKWVLDKSIAPYPILKTQGYYPSVVNYDPVKYYDDSGTEVQRSSVTERNKGKILGELTVNISAGSHGSIKMGKSQITLKRLDKDYDNYNFNYDKVQLPYFNEVGDGNYTDGMVVTGWKVTVSGGSNHYTTGADVTYDTNGKATETPYNFADRKCTEKDNYDNSKRVFSQGAYFDVPYGVTSIDIEAYWGKAAYICDKYYDVVYKKDFTSGTNNIDDMGEQENSLLTGGQTIYTAIGDDNNGALASLTGVSKPTVYDYALVLVGNLHLNDVPSNGTKPFTIMSADFDHDNEPDYSLIYTHFGEPSGRKAVSPIRFDFINVPGMAMAQKPENPDATYFRNVGIFNPKGWFEITNTCNIAFTQFEYDNGGKSAAPLILLGGEFEQFVSTQSSAPTVTQYIHIGGNAWFKEFNNGTHSDGTKFTPHIPISATGGDYDKFYLSGAYKPDADVSADDAEGYISGGRFGEVAGAGQQQIDGNVYWQIYDADITDFYGGGINSDKPITGNITIDIYNSHVTTYCGGPKFGNNDDKVTTNATGCTFTNYYGAGYGGIAYVRKRTQDATSYNFTTWVGQYTTNKGKYFDETTKIGDNSKGEMAGPGVAVDFDYEFFVWSSGATGGRFYIKYASLSFATTNDVVSILNNCDITESYYGGGRLGKVDGTINSTLNGCRVTGNVFGAGYSAERPKVPYRNGGFKSADDIPSIDTNAGVFADGVKSTNIEELELNPGQPLSNATSAIGTAGKIDTNFTEDELKALGTVSGVVTLNINNYTANSNTVQSVITGDVFGGGAMSKTTSNVNVNISGGSVGNVYGGGDQGAVGGNTVVTLSGSTTVNGNVFGGGNEAPVSGSATVNIE